MVRSALPTLVALVVVACATAFDRATSFPIDGSRCTAPRSSATDLALLAEGILAGLPPESDPAPRVVRATCMPANATFQGTGGPPMALPAATTWIFETEGYHEETALGPPFTRRIRDRPYHDVHKLRRGCDAAPCPASPPSASPSRTEPPQTTFSRGYFLVDDATGRAAGYRFFGPRAEPPSLERTAP